jgi:hypothetical protein
MSVRTRPSPGRSRASRQAGASLLAILVGLWLSAAPAGADDSLDLIGTWHVLIHYTDDNTHAPEQLRWDDRVWEFEQAGSQLRWTEYPIVVFQDSDGRFENLGGSHASRVLHAWEPNDRQRAQIEGGLEVSKRGRLSKTLRKRDGEWRSAGRTQAASASIVTYQQNWSIEGDLAKPTFRREDVLGAASTDTLEGVTLYTTTEVQPGANVLVGSFERDGTRHGTFRMTRSGPTEDVKGSGKSNTERLRDGLFKGLMGKPDETAEE